MLCFNYCTAFVAGPVMHELLIKSMYVLWFDSFPYHTHKHIQTQIWHLQGLRFNKDKNWCCRSSGKRKAECRIGASQWQQRTHTRSSMKMQPMRRHTKTPRCWLLTLKRAFQHLFWAPESCIIRDSYELTIKVSMIVPQARQPCTCGMKVLRHRITGSWLMSTQTHEGNGINCNQVDCI